MVLMFHALVVAMVLQQQVHLVVLIHTRIFGPMEQQLVKQTDFLRKVILQLQQT